MLHEFAVEPTVFGTLAEYQLWAERFGIARARVIAKYPQDWVSLAVSAAKEREPGPIKRATIVEGLRRFKEQGKLLDLERKPYLGRDSWIKNALSQHELEPFRAIIAKSSYSTVPGVLEAETVNEATPLFAAEHGCCVRRTAQDMALAIKTILRASKRIAFVDPYFHPSEERFNKPLSAFLLEAVQGVSLQEVTIHLSGELRSSAPTVDFQRACASSLPRCTPHGVKLTILRWKRKASGESLHPRYILTDFCGVRFDHGLDEESEYETTDVELLPESTYKKRLSQFRIGGAEYQHIDSTIVEGVWDCL